MSATGWIRRAGLVGAAAGAVAAGAALGVATERYAGTRRTRSYEPELPAAPPSVETVVITDDGLPLHAEVDGPADAALTLVLCHGYALSSASWVYQRRDLADLGRIVTYDQRGHGRSVRGDRDRSTIDQLGADLERVLAAMAPTGPIVLVGHSMGGMTVMALADRRPDLFGTRIIGVGLISTSPGALAELTLGLPARGGRLLRKAAPALMRPLMAQPGLVARGRRIGAELEIALTRRYSFGSDVPAWLVAFAASMIAETSLETVADFWPAFDAHDKLAALPVLAAVPTLVLVGEDDLLTPPAHSRAIAEALPSAVLVEVPAAGHLVLLEHPETVDAHLRSLVERALAAHAAGAEDRGIAG